MAFEYMKPYGVEREDRGCCPGHDKYPKESYRNRRSKRKQTEATKTAHRRARAVERREVYKLQQDYENNTD